MTNVLNAISQWSNSNSGLLQALAMFGALCGAAGSLVFASYRRVAQSRVKRGARAKPGPTLAVIPFFNMSDDREQERMADSISEDLITDLSKSPKLNVIARNSSFAYKGQSPDIRAVGKALDADYVLEGSLRKAGEMVRVTAQLIRADNGHHVWADRYDRQLGDALAFQDAITNLIAPAVAKALDGPAKASTEPPIGFGAFLDPHLPVPQRPKVQYAHSDGCDIAYTVSGDGPIDIVLAPGLISHLEVGWDLGFAQIATQVFTQFGRFITFDKRGQGMSDPFPTPPTFEQRTDDIRAVMDAAGSSQAILVGMSEGGPMSILFAAMHPERVKGLILAGSSPKFMWSEDWPIGAKVEESTPPEPWLAEWGSGKSRDKFFSEVPEDMFTHEMAARFERMSATPAAVRAQARMLADIDVRALLPAIQVPTMVFHSIHDPAVPFAMGQYMTEHIPHARLVSAAGSAHSPFDAQGVFQRAVGEFCEQVLNTGSVTDHVLATVLAVHTAPESAGVVAKTVAKLAAQYQGRVLESLDSANASIIAFDGPTRAVRCANALRKELPPVAAVRLALDTGLISVSGNRAGGDPIKRAASLASATAPGEIVLTKILRDLLPGTGIALENARLKGETEPLYRALAA